MHTFTVKTLDAGRSPEARFASLNPRFGEYVQGTFDLAELRLSGEIQGEPMFFLGLNRFSLLPGRALKLVGCTNAREVTQSSEYPCGMLGGFPRHAFVPLGIITSLDGLDKYSSALASVTGGTETALGAVADIERFDIPMLEAHDLTFEVWLTRFERTYLGSGYTWAMLCKQPMKHRAVAEPVYLALSNGDRLVGFAYAVEVVS